MFLFKKEEKKLANAYDVWTEDLPYKPFIEYDLANLNRYRILSHCRYDKTVPNQYAIFNVEIMTEDLKNFYQGNYIFEVWDKFGSRMYQKVLKQECRIWNVVENVLVFKSSPTSSIIQMIWLDMQKMTSIKHPFEDNVETGLLYIKGKLLVAQGAEIRAIDITSAAINTYCYNFMQSDETINPIVSKNIDSIPILQPVHFIQYIPERKQTVLVTSNERSQQIEFFSLEFIGDEVKLNIIKGSKNSSDKMGKVREVLWFRYQQQGKKDDHSIFIVHRDNNQIEILKNFMSNSLQTVENLKQVCMHPEYICYKYNDHSFGFSTIDKMGDRNFLAEAEFFSIQKRHINDFNIPFYEDQVILNQSLFLLRDNCIFVYDLFEQAIENTFLFKKKDPIIAITQTRETIINAYGYPNNVFRVIAIHQSGKFTVFDPVQQLQSKQWAATVVDGTSIEKYGDKVVRFFTLNSSHLGADSFFVVTIAVNNEQRLYKVHGPSMVVTGIDIRMVKSELVFPVYSKQNSEMIAVCNSKQIAVYKLVGRNQLVKLMSINCIMQNFNPVLPQSIFYFDKDYTIIMASNMMFKIVNRTLQIESVHLPNNIIGKNSIFSDLEYIYFMMHNSKAQVSNFGIISIEMIDFVFKLQAKETNPAKKESRQVLIPYWQLQGINKIVRDLYNQGIGFVTGDAKLLSMPYYHRNTTTFQGLNNRMDILATKKTDDHFFALDKSSHICCWDLQNGKMLSRTLVDSNTQYSEYVMDREVYDRQWFNHTLIYRKVFEEETQTLLSDHDTPQGGNEGKEKRKYQMVNISEKGQLEIIQEFIHFVPNGRDCHLYISPNKDKMIEILINPYNKTQYQYNIYEWISNSWERQYEVEYPVQFEWHEHSFYPYTLDPDTLEGVDLVNFQHLDIFQCLPNNKIRTYYVQDKIEAIYDILTKKLEAYVVIQNPLKNLYENFYNKRGGKFKKDETTQRLLKFYEEWRTEMLVHFNLSGIKTTEVDFTVNDYKDPYLIETFYTMMTTRFYQMYIQGNEKHLDKILKEMPNTQLIQMLYNIFPEDRNTFIHLVGNNFEAINVISSRSKSEGWIVPFLPDAKKLTPLDVAVEKKDIKLANAFIKMLSKTPLDHHSRFISDDIPKLIEFNIPNLEKYFDSRIFQPGLCQDITSGRLKMDFSGQICKAGCAEILVNQEEDIQSRLMSIKAKEQSISIELLDFPLSSVMKTPDYANQFELDIINSLSKTTATDIFSQKSIRAFIDLMWPIAKKQINRKIFLPYIALILYYTMFVSTLKLEMHRKMHSSFELPEFYENVHLMIEVMMIGGCLYFIQQDLAQIKSTTHPIVIQAYQNLIPMSTIIFIIIWDIFVKHDDFMMMQTFYSISAFLVWTRILHLLRLFNPTAYMLRLAGGILFKMRYLLFFMIISMFAFGYTYSFLKADDDFGAIDGFVFMFDVLLGFYSPSDFSGLFPGILYVMVLFVNYFFIVTLIIAISVNGLSVDNEMDGNQSYQDRCALISLYSYLLQDTLIRDQEDNYVILATSTEEQTRALKRGGGKGGIMGGGGSGNSDDLKKVSKKIIDAFEEKIYSVSQQIDSIKEMNNAEAKDVQDADIVSDNQSTTSAKGGITPGNYSTAINASPRAVSNAPTTRQSVSPGPTSTSQNASMMLSPKGSMLPTRQNSRLSNNMSAVGGDLLAPMGRGLRSTIRKGK